MAVPNNEAVVHMNAGDGETSYTNNSSHQKIGISKTLTVLDEALKDMMNDIHDKHGALLPKCFKIADLGCASGPNSLSIVSHIIEKIQDHLISINTSQLYSPPEFDVFLNDLPENDFNNLFKLLTDDFYRKVNAKGAICFVSALPRSFYGRLFPTNSLHFVYSSYSLHWLSQIPQGLESNKENIHVAISSPREVYEAYKKQYHNDFSKFLRSRAQEMVSKGRMVLTCVSRSVEDPSSKNDSVHFALLADALLDMVKQGLMKESDLHSFNMPAYTPCRQEIEAMVCGEGSFDVERLEEVLVPWDAHVERGSANVHQYGIMITRFIRAFSEPILAAHFGSSAMDALYENYAQKFGELMSKEVLSYPILIICLSKR